MGLVQSFCCCGTLRQGAITAGIVFMIRGLAIVVVGGLTIAMVSELEEESLVHDDEKREFTKEEKELVERIIVGIGAVLVLFGALMVLASVLLFIGVSKSKPGFLKPWIVAQTIEFCLYAVLTGFMLARGEFPIISIGPFGVFVIYLYIVVLSYHKALLNPQTTQIPISMQMTQVSIPSTGNPNQPACFVSLAGPGPPMAPPYGYPGMNPAVGYPAGNYATTPGSPLATRAVYTGTYDKVPGSPVSPIERYPKMIPAPGLNPGTYTRMPTTGYYAPATGLVTTTENDPSNGFENASPLRASKSWEASPTAPISPTDPYSTSPPPYKPPPPPHKEI